MDAEDGFSVRFESCVTSTAQDMGPFARFRWPSAAVSTTLLSSVRFAATLRTTQRVLSDSRVSAQSGPLGLRLVIGGVEGRRVAGATRGVVESAE